MLHNLSWYSTGRRGPRAPTAHAGAGDRVLSSRPAVEDLGAWGSPSPELGGSPLLHGNSRTGRGQDVAPVIFRRVSGSLARGREGGQDRDPVLSGRADRITPGSVSKAAGDNPVCERAE